MVRGESRERPLQFLWPMTMSCIIRWDPHGEKIGTIYLKKWAHTPQDADSPAQESNCLSSHVTFAPYNSLYVDWWMSFTSFLAIYYTWYIHTSSCIHAWIMDDIPASDILDHWWAYIHNTLYMKQNICTSSYEHTSITWNISRKCIVSGHSSTSLVTWMANFLWRKIIARI